MQLADLTPADLDRLVRDVQMCRIRLEAAETKSRAARQALASAIDELVTATERFRTGASVSPMLGNGGGKGRAKRQVHNAAAFHQLAKAGVSSVVCGTVGDSTGGMVKVEVGGLRFQLPSLLARLLKILAFPDKPSEPDGFVAFQSLNAVTKALYGRVDRNKHRRTTQAIYRLRTALREAELSPRLIESCGALRRFKRRVDR
jgi:hypothetical protein